MPKQPPPRPLERVRCHVSCPSYPTRDDGHLARLSSSRHRVFSFAISRSAPFCYAGVVSPPSPPSCLPAVFCLTATRTVVISQIVAVFSVVEGAISSTMPQTAAMISVGVPQLRSAAPTTRPAPRRHAAAPTPPHPGHSQRWDSHHRVVSQSSALARVALQSLVVLPPQLILSSPPLSSSHVPQ